MRIFLSSTFLDMQEERDVLVRRVFPELRRRARIRGVEVVEVDLRWGIERAQAECGAALGLCLAEISHCHPYFVALLGDRYGWVPDSLSPELMREHPWLADHSDCSITELEIVYGALTSATNRALCFFRSAETSKRIERELGLAQESAADQANLEALKQRIRASGISVWEDYESPEIVGDLLIEELWRLLDADFPATEEFDAEAQDHHVQGFRIRRGFFDVTGELQVLDRLVDSAAGPVVVSGESGTGKSSLVAAWAERRAKEQGAEVFQHYVGAAPFSDRTAMVARRLLGTRTFNNDEDAIESLAKYLATARDGPELIVVLDGAEGLDEDESQFVWLPDRLPRGIRVVLTARPGQLLNVLQRREMPLLQLRPLGEDEIGAFSRHHLQRVGKSLERERLDRLTGTVACRNLRFLHIVLEELRVFGKFHELDARIGECTSATDVAALYDLVLGRLERDHTTLGQDALALLACARHGLTETELRDLLGNGSPLPGARLSSLLLAAEDQLEGAGGKLRLQHDFASAVARRYLRSDESRRSVHLRLAGYFLAHKDASRSVQECGWSLLAALAHDRLAQWLADSETLATYCETAWDDIRALWASLPRSTADGIRARVSSREPSEEKDTACVAYLAQLHEEHGDKEPAGELWACLNDHMLDSDHVGFLLKRSSSGLQFSASAETIPVAEWNGTVIVSAQYDEADGQKFPMFRREQDARRRYAQKLLNLAGWESTSGQHAEAAAIYRRSRELFERVGDFHRVVWILGKERELLEELGGLASLDDELAQYEWRFRVRRDAIPLARVLVERALIQARRRTYDTMDSAVALDEAERILAQHNDANGLAKCALARTLLNAGRRDAAGRRWWQRLLGKRKGSAASETGSAAPEVSTDWEISLLVGFGGTDPELLAAATDRIEAGATEGDARAEYLMGVMYRGSHGVVADPREACLWFQRAAERGYPDAQWRLALAHLRANGVPLDLDAAIRLLEAAAPYQDDAAQLLPQARIARDYVVDLEAKANDGDLEAQTELGALFLGGELGFTSAKVAAFWLEKAANQNDPRAQTMLAGMLLRGDGVPKNATAAVSWYGKAAEQGFAPAQDMMGTLTEDRLAARRWFRLAAEQGNRHGQFSLGRALLDGDGGPRDSKEALEWISRAADQGHEEARLLLEEMELPA